MELTPELETRIRAQAELGDVTGMDIDELTFVRHAVADRVSPDELDRLDMAITNIQIADNPLHQQRVRDLVEGYRCGEVAGLNADQIREKAAQLRR